MLVFGSFLMLCTTACTDFVEADFPNNQLPAEAIFENAATTTAALADIYAQMRDIGLVTGNISGVSLQLGLYADELDYFSYGQGEFYNHTILASDNDSSASAWWYSSYNLIYAANAVVNGVENSMSLSSEDRDRLMGEGLFIRAYLHVFLVELYGDIPYITTTNYEENSTVSRMPKAMVYEKIIEDLDTAVNLLPDADSTGEQLIPYSTVADALLARVYLYTEDWGSAETATNKVISKFGGLEPDLNKVFLNYASGTIWQFKPKSDGDNTYEAITFIPAWAPPSTNAISNSLITAFEPNDQRRSAWIGEITDGLDTWSYAFKYKQGGNAGASVEYSILFRLAEQYLIRAEARAHLGNVSSAQQDINAVRNRAGLGGTTATTLDELLDAVLEERRVELFTEFGHRWFDLKRMGKAAIALSPFKPNWKDSDLLLPIPESELLVNPNLLPQNPGYN